MGVGGVGQRVGAPDVDFQPAFDDPVEKLRRMGAQQIRRRDVVHEDRIADLDALRDAGDLNRAGAAQYRAEPAQRAATTQRIERCLPRHGTRAVIGDMHAFAVSQAHGFFGKIAASIHDDMIGTGLTRDPDLLLRGTPGR